MKYLFALLVLCTCGCIRDTYYLSDSGKLKVTPNHANLLPVVQDMNCQLIISHFLSAQDLNVYFIIESRDSFHITEAKIICSVSKDTLIPYTTWTGTWYPDRNDFSPSRSWLSNADSITPYRNNDTGRFTLALCQEYRDTKKAKRLHLYYTIAGQSKGSIFSITGSDTFTPETDYRLMKFPDDFRSH